MVTQTCSLSFKLLAMNCMCTTVPVSLCPAEKVDVQMWYINTVPIVYQTNALIAWEKKVIPKRYIFHTFKLFNLSTICSFISCSHMKKLVWVWVFFFPGVKARLTVSSWICSFLTYFLSYWHYLSFLWDFSFFFWASPDFWELMENPH